MSETLPDGGLTPDETPKASSRRRARRVQTTVAVFLVLAVLVGVSFASRFGADPKAVRSPLIDEPAPTFDLAKLDGTGTTSLDSLRGQIVVLNFWAPWCVPCRAEHADLTEASRQLAAQGVRIVGVVNDADVADARRFVDERGDLYAQLVEQRSASTIDYGVLGVPETFFIDREGIVRGKVAGSVDLQTVLATVAEIEAREPGSS